MRRGWTLVEVLVAASLLVLGLSVLTAVLVPALESSRTGSQLAQLQQQAALIVEWVASDLAATPPAGFRAQPIPEGLVLALHPVSDITSSSTLTWSDQAVLYSWDFENRSLLRKRWPGMTTNGPFLPDPAALHTAATTASPEDRVLSRAVIFFQVTFTGGVNNPLVSLELQLSHPDSPPERTIELRHQRSFFLRNSG